MRRAQRAAPRDVVGLTAAEAGSLQEWFDGLLPLDQEEHGAAGGTSGGEQGEVGGMDRVEVDAVRGARAGRH